MLSISNLDTIKQIKFNTHSNKNLFGEELENSMYDHINKKIGEDESFNNRMIL